MPRMNARPGSCARLYSEALKVRGGAFSRCCRLFTQIASISGVLLLNGIHYGRAVRH